MTEAMDHLDLPRTVRVLVVVGTDHHAFDRLVGWTDQWARDRRLDPEEILIQHGQARAPRLVRGVPLLPYGTLVSLMEHADAVVIQGGPASLADARRVGRLPICVPRDPTQGEHVDNHQQLFARRMDSAGMLRCATTEEHYVQLLDEAIEHPEHFRIPPAERDHLPAVGNVARIIEGLLAARSRGRKPS